MTGSGKRDSNSRPRPWQGRALPTELFPQDVNDTFSWNGTAKILQKSESPNIFSFFWIPRRGSERQEGVLGLLEGGHSE